MFTTTSHFFMFSTAGVLDNFGKLTIRVETAFGTVVSGGISSSVCRIKHEVCCSGGKCTFVVLSAIVVQILAIAGAASLAKG